MLVVSSETSGCDLPFLVSRNWCRDLNSMSRPHSLCLYCIFVSRPHFYLSSSLLLGHSFSFMLQHPSVVLNFQAGRDSKLLVCFLIVTWTLGSDQVFSLILAILVATSKVFREPHYSVSTVSFNFSIFGRELTVLPCFGIYVATSI